ncbi:TRAP transporter substrate-binding protein [Virgibacillus sp. W0181]|uniref:TRAP transporter substrate-binding protein n=1 Tax=Virgibacillus sp. W0181 TaxID=3391581 RepID=UPI003F45C69E
MILSYKKVGIVILFTCFILLMGACNNDVNGSNDSNTDANNNAEYSKDSPIVLKYNEQNPAGNPNAILAEDFSELVEEKTEGRVQIDVYLGGSAADYGIEPVISGLVDFNQMTPGNVSDLAPSFSVLDAPYLFEDMDHFLEAVDPESEIMEKLNEKLSLEGVRAIAVAPSGKRHLTTTDKPVKRLDDMKGLKIRVVPSDIYSDTMKSLGAAPSAMPFSEVSTSLTTGIIDGQENPFSQIVPNGLQEIQDYIMLTGHIFSSGAIFMNNDQFEKLTEQDQTLLLEAGREAAEKKVKLMEEKETEWIKKAEEEATIIGEKDGLDLEEFKEAAKEVHEKYQGEWGEVYNKILELR